MTGRNGMDTIQDIEARMTELWSREGTIRFIAQRTFLPLERVERIYDEGAPWPTLDDYPRLPCIRPILSGKISAKSLDLMEQFQQPNVEFKISQLRAFWSARMEGDVSMFDAEREWIDPIFEHLEEVAHLSHESLDKVYEVVQAETARKKTLC